MLIGFRFFLMVSRNSFFLGLVSWNLWLVRNWLVIWLNATWRLFWSTPSEKVTNICHDCFAMRCQFWRGRTYWTKVCGRAQDVLLQGNTGECLRALQPYDSAGERYFARLASEANGFRLCLIFFELLLKFLHRNARFDCGWAGNCAVDLSSGDLSMCCFFCHGESLVLLHWF